MLRFLTLLSLHLLLLLPASAELRLAHIFQDNMVMQRELKAPVWGWADAGAEVKVSFAGQTKTAKANDKGYWIVELDPMPANATGQSLTVESGATKIERKNALIGEVWVLSGQSNMARTLNADKFNSKIFAEYPKDANYPEIRFIHFGFGASLTPLDDVDPFVRKDQAWQILSETTAGDVMSIGFFFAKKLFKDLNVPVGLVQVAVPGVPQTAWMPRETMEATPVDGGKNMYDTTLADKEAGLAKVSKGALKNYADFEAAQEKWRADPAATARTWPGGAPLNDYPSALYNTRVYPLAPFAFRGMLWHQGEAGPFGAYGDRMMATVKRMREVFKNDFVFIFGTMTRFTRISPSLTPISTPHRSGIDLGMIEGDLKIGDAGRATLVNFFDLGNSGTHWARKEEAGRRMELAALQLAYGKPQVFTGPELIESKISGNQVECKFRYVGDGLKYEPSIDGISGFIIVDKSGTTVWGDVKITGKDTLTISSPQTPNPTGAVYALQANPYETLFNSADMPAFEFRAGDARPKAEESLLITKLSGGGEKTDMHISHVRRNGYVVSAVDGTLTGDLVLKCYVPAEWKGLEVRKGAELIPTPTPTEEGGKKYIQITVPINGDAFTIADQGASEALSKVNRF